MDDSVPHRPWAISPETRHAVLLGEAREALARGEAERAVALAEEVLDVDPDEVDALRLIADAAPRFGHAEVGVLAARQLRARGRDPGAVEAAALLAACEVEQALAVADARIAADSADARAWAVRGQALEILERFGEADEALGAAHRLDPGRYPRPLPVDDQGWDLLVLAAASRMDDPERDRLRAVHLEVRTAPRLDELRSVHPPASPNTAALLLETPGVRPTIAVYRRNVLRGALTENEAIDRLVDALAAELTLLETDA